MNCPNCGTELSESSTVCTVCGAAVQPQLTPEERARKRWQEREQQRREKKKQKKNKQTVSAALTPEDIFAAVAKSSHNAASQPHESVMISIEEEPTDNPMADVIQTLVKELDDDRSIKEAMPDAVSLLHTPTEAELPAQSTPKAAEVQRAVSPEPEAAPTGHPATVAELPSPSETKPVAVEKPISAPAAAEEASEPTKPVTPTAAATPAKEPQIVRRSLASQTIPPVPAPIKTADDDFDFQPIRLADALKINSAPRPTEKSVSEPSDATAETPTPSAPTVQESFDETVTLPKTVSRRHPLHTMPPTRDTVVAAPLSSKPAAAASDTPTHSTSEHGTMRFNVADALASMPEQTDTVIPDIRIPEAYARARYVPQDSPQWAQEAAQDEENDWEGFDPEDADWIDEDETRHPRRFLLICVILAVMVALAVYSVATSGMI